MATADSTKDVSKDEGKKSDDLYSRYVTYYNNLLPHVNAIVNAFDFSIYPTAVDLGGKPVTEKRDVFFEARTSLFCSFVFHGSKWFQVDLERSLLDSASDTQK